MRLYFDTTYVAKCYLNEPDCKHVRKLVAGATGRCSSLWCVAEMACVFQRRIREGFLAAAQAAQLRRTFLEDVQNGVWYFFPLPEGLVFQVESVVAGLPPTVYLRAGDAVHLISARLAGFTEVWTNDRHLIVAAPYFGLTGRSV